MDAASIRTHQVHEGIHLGVAALQIAVAGIEQDRHLDPLHAYPVDRVVAKLQRLGGDIGCREG